MAPIEWNEHWALNREPEGATKFAVEMAARVGRFIDERDVRYAADFGCGPATTLFELAGMYPSIDFYGFDIAESVTRNNKEKAEKDGFRNIFFETDGLPGTRTLRRFDLVLCFSTLHYINDIDSALRSLFELVNPRGHLIFNYPSIHTKRMFEKDYRGDEYMEKRFSVLLSGDNVTSQREIRRILGVYPRRFYSSKIHNVYVIVRKPRSG
jgi:SAM-dependent methyltransferase